MESVPNLVAMARYNRCASNAAHSKPFEYSPEIPKIEVTASERDFIDILAAHTGLSPKKFRSSCGRPNTHKRTLTT
jgi:hypothetical protein